MILQALNDYYLRLEQAGADVAPIGFSRQKIAFCLALKPDGSLQGIEDLRQPAGKNLVPKSLIVLGDAKPTGSGINPGVLWDNTAYLLGFKPEDPNAERTRESFDAFRDRHLSLESEIGDVEFSAVCRFLKDWRPERAAEFPFLAELKSGFGVFRMSGATHFVHERPAVRDWWLRELAKGDGDDAAVTAQCLVLGRELPVARLHAPKIKGVLGAQTAGAALVSFNQNAFESYDKEQSFNAPVSVAATFQYCTALNVLLAAGSRQRLQIGDATVVFWTDRPSPAEEFMGLVFDTTAAEDETLKMRLHAVLERIREGGFPPELGDPETVFYVLGLSANASRLSVRFWLMNTLETLVRHFHEHFRDLEIVRSPRDPEFPALWQILRETARESKDIPPLLSGAVMRSILNGTRYPDILFSSIVRRIRADRQIRYLRAATLKACLNRNPSPIQGASRKEIGVTLEIERPEPAYQLGRFFAALEKAQEDALPEINDTIKDRYFGAASATPRAVFPRLIRLNQHHLGKLERGHRVNHEKRIQEICSRLDGFPSHLNLEGQGLFAIGYYHQRQAFFTKKSSSDSHSEE